MLDRIRKKILGKRYTTMEEYIESYKRSTGCLLSLLEEVKAERDELKLELTEVYTYASELKAKLRSKGE